MSGYIGRIIHRGLLDQFIRSIEHLRWNRNADLLGGLKIDDQFKLGWPFHREIARLGPFQDPIYIGSGACPRFTGLLLARVTTGEEIYEIRYHLVNAALSFDLFDNLMLRPLRQHS